MVEVPLAIERTIYLADASILWILLVQSKSLGITWKSSIAEISIGFICISLCRRPLGLW